MGYGLNQIKLSLVFDFAMQLQLHLPHLRKDFLNPFGREKKTTKKQ